MKKILVLSLLIVSLVFAAFIMGCSQSQSGTTTTTTTTLPPGANTGQTASNTVQTVVGISQTSQSLGSLAGVTSGMSVGGYKKIFTGTPPTAFFNPLPSNGWITIEGMGFTTGETVQIRMYTKGGQVINGGLLASIKLATLEGFSWQTMISTFEFSKFSAGVNSWLNYNTDWDPASATKIAAFYTNTNTNKYRTLQTLWDYIVWAHISKHMGNALPYGYRFYPTFLTPPQAARADIGTYPVLGTPEATSNDGFGTQEVHVSGKNPKGETIDFTQSVSTDANGKPSSMTGTGTITRTDGVVMTVIMTMNFSSGAPSGGTMDITVPSPEAIHIVITMTATGAASGDVYTTLTSPETKIGTIVIYGTQDPATGYYGYFEDRLTSTKYYF